MRVAALYDIHGNLPALEAVLEEIQTEGIHYVGVSITSLLRSPTQPIVGKIACR